MKPYKRNTIFMFCWIARRMPGYVMQYFLYAILTQLSMFLGNVLLLKIMTEIILSRENRMRAVSVMAAFAVYCIGANIYRAYFREYGQKRAKERMGALLHREIYDRAVKVDLADYDNKEFYQAFLLATDDAENQIDRFLNAVTEFISCACNVALTSAVFFSIDGGVLLFAVSAAAVTLLPHRHILRLKRGRKEKEKSYERKRQYFFHCFYLKDYLKEIQTGGMEGLLLEYDGENNRDYLHAVEKENRGLAGLNIVQNVLPEHVIMNFGLCGYLLYKVFIAGTVTAAGFIAAFNGINVLVSGLYRMLGYCVGQIKENEIFIRNFRSFLDYRPSIRGGERKREGKEFTGIEIRDLHFAYPGKEAEVLSGIRMDIPAGKKIAIVGRNGCGKTTFVMNLLRLYQSSAGKIYLDGADAEEYDLQSYRETFVSLFQDYKLFAVSVAENISMDEEYEEEKVKTVLKKEGLGEIAEDVTRTVYREFDREGLELSGGQQQRLATGRVMYSDAPVMVLDEPSSALDAIEEKRFNQAIAEASEKRTVIFISHRLTTVRMADVIYVIEDGKILEKGTHEELIGNHSLYERMWRIQTEAYQ